MATTQNKSATLSSSRLQQLVAEARARAIALQTAAPLLQAGPSIDSNISTTTSTIPPASEASRPAQNQNLPTQLSLLTASSNQSAQASTPALGQDSSPLERSEICGFAPIVDNNIAANTSLQQQGFQWNQEQQEALMLFKQWKSFAIVGSAGTGKSTLCKAGILAKCQDSAMPMIASSEETKVLKAGLPGIIAVSFTKSAVANIARIVDNCVPVLTIHKLLEFSPVYYEEVQEDGSIKMKRIFEPARNSSNPLPATLRTIIIEESGIVNIRLFNQLLDALPNPSAVQFIFLGDLFQLTPPYDPAILGYSLNAIPVVELTRVYRQALNSPILSFALDIKEQKTWGSQHFAALCCDNEHGYLEVRPWKHRLDSFKATEQAAKFIEKEYQAGKWHPERSCIITPYGAALNSKDKEAAFGSYNLNRLIANFLGKARGAIIHEVIAGFAKHYLAVGDEISYQKIRGKISAIKRNGSYMGKLSPQPASSTLDRFGYNINAAHDSLLDLEAGEHDIEKEMDRLLAAASADNKEAFRNASHVVELTLETNEIIELSSSGDFNPQVFDFSYAMTCYKAQGQEWDSVYVFTHKSHATMLCNEFFYTACTRAKKRLTLVCEPDHLMNAVKRQDTPGSNWREKSAKFNTTKALESIKPFAALCDWLLGEGKKQAREASFN